MTKALLRKRQEGFTLVELMIVVAIIGVLAALAIYGVTRYLRHAKTAEATRALGAIETGSKVQFNNETDVACQADPANCLAPLGQSFVHVFCPASGVQPPAVPAATRVLVLGAAWNADIGFKCLKFGMGEPIYYQYAHATNGLTGPAGTYNATAQGDLNGDGVLSTFRVSGVVDPASMEARRANLTITNEDE